MDDLDSPRFDTLRRFLVAVVGVSVWAAPGAIAAECVSLRPGLGPAAASSVGLFVDPRLPAHEVERAVDAWGVCSEPGGDFPPLRVGTAGTRDLFIRFDPAAIGLAERCGEFSGRTITLFSRTRASDGSVVRCGSLAQNLTHELGHALGLADAPRTCDSFAMAKLNPSNGFHRKVQPAECRWIGQRWQTLPELPGEGDSRALLQRQAVR